MHTTTLLPRSTRGILLLLLLTVLSGATCGARSILPSKVKGVQAGLRRAEVVDDNDDRPQQQQHVRRRRRRIRPHTDDGDTAAHSRKFVRVKPDKLTLQDRTHHDFGTELEREHVVRIHPPVLFCLVLFCFVLLFVTAPVALRRTHHATRGHTDR